MDLSNESKEDRLYKRKIKKLIALTKKEAVQFQDGFSIEKLRELNSKDLIGNRGKQSKEADQVNP